MTAISYYIILLKSKKQDFCSKIFWSQINIYIHIYCNTELNITKTDKSLNF